MSIRYKEAQCLPAGRVLNDTVEHHHDCGAEFEVSGNLLICWECRTIVRFYEEKPTVAEELGSVECREALDRLNGALDELKEKVYRPTVIYVCPDCESEDVQETAWVEANTGNVVSQGKDGPRDVFWCNSCENEQKGLYDKCPHCGAVETDEQDIIMHEEETGLSFCWSCGKGVSR